MNSFRHSFWPLLISLIFLVLALPALAQDTNPLKIDGPNVYKYTGAPATFNVPLDNTGVTATGIRQPNGRYTLAVYADPEGGAIFCGTQDGGQMTEDIKMLRYAPSKGYRYEYYLGNLVGKQRDKMPVGTLDQPNKRVVFTDVELKPGQQNVRINLKVRVFGPNGVEVKAPNPAGFYGWMTEDVDKSVIGIKDNGLLFDVLQDGTIQAKGEDHRHPS